MTAGAIDAKGQKDKEQERQRQRQSRREQGTRGPTHSESRPLALCQAHESLWEPCPYKAISPPSPSTLVPGPLKPPGSGDFQFHGQRHLEHCAEKGAVSMSALCEQECHHRLVMSALGRDTFTHWLSRVRLFLGPEKRTILFRFQVLEMDSGQFFPTVGSDCARTGAPEG